MRRPNFSYTKYGGLERSHKSGKRSYPYVKKLFKTQCGIDPAMLVATIISYKKLKIKILMRGSEAMRVETRNRRLFFFFF